MPGWAHREPGTLTPAPDPVSRTAAGRQVCRWELHHCITKTQTMSSTWPLALAGHSARRAMMAARRERKTITVASLCQIPAGIRVGSQKLPVIASRQSSVTLSS